MGFSILIEQRGTDDWVARIYAETARGVVAIGGTRGPWRRVVPVIVLAEIYVILWRNDLAACERLIGAAPSPRPPAVQ